MWPSALAAAFFALHPMHVESVAWVSERKDVLSALFCLLTLWTYLRYVEELKVNSAKAKMFYLGSVALFALGLMAKPMLVTLPFVLLLLDYWPLPRTGGPPSGGWWKKSRFSSWRRRHARLAYLAQRHGGSVSPLSDLSVGERLMGVPISYAGLHREDFLAGSFGGFVSVAGSMAGLAGRGSRGAFWRW